MSQRAEKYARSMERRVAEMEGRVDRIRMDVTRHSVCISTVEAFAKAMTTGRRAERAAHRKKVARRNRLLLGAVLIAIALACLLFSTNGEAADNGGQSTRDPAAVEVLTVAPVYVPAVSDTDTVEEDPLEAEKIEAALLAMGYLSDAVPLHYDLQDVMRTACMDYGCPYPLALATADWETRGTFDMDAVGAAGEVGIMQLNPGPSGAYHAALEEATGKDPTTPAGNIVCGVYLLGQYLGKYGDPAKAAMAYNMGEDGARKAWAAGITSTEYSAAVMGAMEVWECTVNAWNGR